MGRQLLMNPAALGRKQFFSLVWQKDIDHILQYLLPRWYEVKEYSGFLGGVMSSASIRMAAGFTLSSVIPSVIMF